MCGRYSLAIPKEQIEQRLSIQINQALKPSYNIAPTHQAYVMTAEQPLRLQPMYWGLIPHWSKQAKLTGKHINARKEGIQTKPSFRLSVRYRRCLVPADSFYEWRTEGQVKIPYRIHNTDLSMMVMAGIWDEWTDGQSSIRTFSIITTPPNEEMQSIHTRMPLFLETANQQSNWLNSADLNEVLGMMNVLENNRLSMYRISTELNKPQNNYAELQKAVPEPPTLFS